MVASKHGAAAELAKEAAPALAFREHPDRQLALAEAHARPSIPINPPCTIIHLAFAVKDATAADALYRHYFAFAPKGGERHGIREQAGVTVKWERHTEFVSLTIVAPGGGERADPMLAELATKLPDGASLLVALRFIVLKAPRPEGPHETVGGRLRGGIEVATTFRVGEDGIMNWEVNAPETGAGQLGRRIQRLLDAESYRVMALLGLPLARRVGPIVARLEQDLAAVIQSLTDGVDDDEAILERLQRLSAEAEAVREQTRFRFAASLAYAALVNERLDSLNEQKVGEQPTITGFIKTRLKPAVRTIESTEKRQEQLSSAVSRSINLLRARVDVSMNQANQDILKSMDERQRRQLILSEAVENLSVIAISYYLLGILYYPVRAVIETTGIGVSDILVLGVLAPFVAVSVYYGMRMLRSRLGGR